MNNISPFEINKIYNEDCLEALKKLPDNSIDLIITSPPYNIGKMHSNRIQYGTYQGNDMKEEDYQKWQIDILNECYRVLKNDGSMFYNHKVRIKNGLGIHPLEWVLKTKFIFKQEIVWDRGNGVNNDKIRFFPYSERIYWLTKNAKTKLYNNKCLSDVWRVVVKHKRKEIGHIAVMVDEIVENILSCFEKKSLVVDPFLGSGTTCRVAKKMGMNYLGFEIDEEYFNLSDSNIKNQERVGDNNGIE